MSSTVTKALGLLEHFSESEPELGLSELARRAGIDKSAVHRMMSSMADAGLVEQQRDSRLYRLGAGILRLARVRETAFPIGAIIQPTLVRLSEVTGETAHASLISGRSLGNVGISESKKGNRVSLTPGEILPLHSTASGLATLAFGDETLLSTVVAAGLSAKTKYTLINVEDLQGKIETIRSLGYSESDQANEEGVHGLAAPIFDRTGLACGAVSVSSPSTRVTPEQLERNISAALLAARTISADIGGRIPQSYSNMVSSVIGDDA